MCQVAFTCLTARGWGDFQVDLAFNQDWGRGRILRYGGEEGNLLQHAGMVSSFSYRNEDSFRKNYDERRFGSVVAQCRCGRPADVGPCCTRNGQMLSLSLAGVDVLRA